MTKRYYKKSAPKKKTKEISLRYYLLLLRYSFLKERNQKLSPLE